MFFFGFYAVSTLCFRFMISRYLSIRKSACRLISCDRENIYEGLFLFLMVLAEYFTGCFDVWVFYVLIGGLLDLIEILPGYFLILILELCNTFLQRLVIIINLFLQLFHLNFIIIPITTATTATGLLIRWLITSHILNTNKWK